jgi:hypothetical protein
MKTVLIGSDFMYDKDGILKPIEINTNVGVTKYHIEDFNNIFDTTELVDFITQNGFIKIDYIGSSLPIRDAFTSMSIDLSIDFEYHEVLAGSITIPYVEDTETNLIIRSAYDTTALVDETYCRDKIGFLNLIQSQSFGAQFAYLNEDKELINNITTIPDNGVHPNFILKSRYPAYDKEVFPKLYRVTTQSELDIVLQNVNDDYFIMEYYYNPEYHINDKVTKKRSLNILYPPTLLSIPIGNYTDTTIQKLVNNPEYNSLTFELLHNYRNAYITTDNQAIVKPKLLDNDLVQMADGTFKTAVELEVGDEIRTIDIPNAENVDTVAQTVNYKIDLESFISGSTYSTNKVTQKSRIDVDVNIVEILFTDGSTWEDTALSSYLVERDSEVRFILVNNLKNGDIVLLIDTSDNTNVNVVPKIVESITYVNKIFTGWIISVERRHLFLTVTDSSTQNLSYAAIEHNYGEFCSAAGSGQCGPPYCPKSLGCTFSYGYFAYRCIFYC